MTLDELNKVDVNSPEQVKALQNFLKSRGYYNGGIDGKWGGGTIEAVKSLRTDLQTESTNATRQTEAKASENSAGAQATRFATKFGPYALGVGTGMLAGSKIAGSLDAKDAELKDTAARLAKAKDVNPIIAERTLDTGNRRRLTRSGTQFLAPAALLGMSEVTRRYIAPQFDDEKTREYVNLGATAEQAAGGTLAVKQLFNLPKRSSPVDPVDEARIRSRAAEARGDPYTISNKPAPAGEAPKVDPARLAELRAKRAADLRTEAKAAGLHVSGTKEDLVRRIAEAPPPAQSAPAKAGRTPRGKAGLLAPFAAGALAYDAATSDAEAAGVDPVDARMRGVTAGAGAAGITAAVPYAISKLPEVVGRAASTASVGLAPGGIDAMTDYSEDELAQGRNMLARYLPSWARAGAVEEAYQASLVPERNPRFAARQAGVEARGEGQGNDFDAHLQAFIDAVNEHNGGVDGYGP